MQKEKYFFGIIAIDGKLESYIGPLMPQTQRANTCLYQQCEKQIHLLSQIHPLTALSHSGLSSTVQVTEATAGPRGSQQPAGPGQGQGQPLHHIGSLSATSGSETCPQGSESLLK